MANARDRVMNSTTKAQAALLRRENRIAKAVMDAYAQARQELQALFMERFANLGDLTPAQLRQLANDGTLLASIDSEMNKLAIEFRQIMGEGIKETSRAGMLQAQAEVLFLANALNISIVGLSIDPMLATLVEVVVDQVPDVVDATRKLLKNEMRVGLISGERMQELSRRLFQKTPVDGRASVFRRGMTSADLFTRRAVIQANNNSKQIFIERAAEQVPGLQRQVVAHLGRNTTETCLKAHGQIVAVDEPFELAGQPRFARKMMHPPFHWNCRTTVVAYHPDFEAESSLATADMKREARELLNA